MNKKKEEKKNRRNKVWLSIIILVLVTFGVYSNSLNAPFIFDDIHKIVNNPDIKKLSNLPEKLIYPYSKEHKTFNRNDPSRPLVYLTYTLNYHFGKLNPFGYHLVNVFLHVFNVILMFFLTKKIILYVYKNNSYLFPFLVSLLFAVHPVNIDAVTYTFARSGVLATLFYILSLICFTKILEKGKRFCYFSLSLLFFILALASKPIAVTLPAIILFFDYIILSNYDINKVKTRKYYHIILWIILITYLIYRYFYLGGFGDIEISSEIRLSRYPYLIIQPYIILKYFKLLLFPSGLCIYHYIMPSSNIFKPQILISILVVVSIFVFTFINYKKRKFESKLIIFSILWFFITLSPSSTIFPTAIVLSERRLYLSGYGFYLLMIFLYFFVVIRTKKNNYIYYPIILYIATLSVFTIKRNKLYQEPAIMWQEAIFEYPQNFMAHLYLGNIYKEKKEYSNAIPEFQKALYIIQNEDQQQYEKLYNFHEILGWLYKEQNEYIKAIEEYQQAIVLNPENYKAHNNLGLLYYYQKDYTKAMQAYKKAINLNPENVNAYANLGLLYHEQKEYIKAIQKYQKAINIDPDSFKFHYKLGVLFHEIGDFNKAKEFINKSILLNKKDNINAYIYLGGIYQKERDFKKAIQIYKRALGIDNTAFVALYNMALAYDNSGNINNAIKYYTESIEIRENIPEKKPLLKDIKKRIKELKNM
jgi:tetratricopeptide (TPR) repeat protein